MTLRQPRPAFSSPSSTGPGLAARWVLILLLLTSYPLATVLPATFGWENGPIENAQIVVLLAGFLYAARVRWGLRAESHDTAADTTVRRLCLIAMPLWLMCAARETSWGATLLTSGIMTPDGPYFSSSTMWYHPAIKPLVLGVVACAAGVFLRWRLDRPLLALMRQHRFPWPELVLIALSALLSTTAEGNLPVKLPGPPATLLVLEEWAELMSYLGLCLAQLRLFDALRRPSNVVVGGPQPASVPTAHPAAPEGTGR
jgi:hypothetical protein